MKDLEFLLDTDILLEHLRRPKDGRPSVLEALAGQGMCFTTVLNATELFLEASNDIEKDAAFSVLSAINVLGIHQRYALQTPELRTITENVRDLLFLSVSANNKLPVISFQPEKYGGYAVPIPTELKGITYLK